MFLLNLCLYINFSNKHTVAWAVKSAILLRYFLCSKFWRWLIWFAIELWKYFRCLRHHNCKSFFLLVCGSWIFLGVKWGYALLNMHFSILNTSINKFNHTETRLCYLRLFICNCQNTQSFLTWSILSFEICTDIYAFLGVVKRILTVINRISQHHVCISEMVGPSRAY